jgi:hypothetical protein
MVTIGALLQHLAANDAAKTPAKAALMNYLKGFFDAKTPFLPAYLDQFYEHALAFPYWQTEKKILGETLRNEMIKLQESGRLDLDFQNYRHVSERQWISIDHEDDFLQLLNPEKLVPTTDANAPKSHFDRITHFKLSQVEYLTVQLTPARQVIAEIRKPMAAIVKGQLRLIRPLTRLGYGPDIELMENFVQSISISSLRHALFTVHGSMVRGTYFQGHLFAGMESFEKRLEDTHELFHSIKKIERFFVNPTTDPYYQHLMEHFR